MNVDTDDMGIFLSDFAITITATTWGTSFQGIFDFEYVEFGTHSGVKPVALIQASDVKAGYATGDNFTIDDTAYQLVDVQYAEPGMRRLVFADT